MKLEIGKQVEAEEELSVEKRILKDIVMILEIDRMIFKAYNTIAAQ